MAQKSLLGLSLLVHGALGLAIAQVEIRKSRAATAIEMAESKQREAEKKPEEPPKTAPEPPKRVARRAVAVEKPSEAPPPPEPAAPLSALPDFGLELGGAVGGIPIAAPTPVASALGSAPVARAAAPLVKRPALASAEAELVCDEPAQKPKPRNIPQPVYTDRAREAGIEGKVRVELTVDETGRVVSARVLQGLGYGLDEAALAAAERATFEPATRCGKPTRATFTMGIRFSAA
ncbi:MAG: TonB family protein [Myxococcota bacterium]